MKNAVLDCLMAHRSIRSFTDQAVSDEDMDSIIGAVQAAPNWVNLQLVSVIAIKDPERRQVFSRLCGGQPHVAQAPVFLIFCADYHRVALACEEKGQRLDEAMQDIEMVIVGAHEAGIALEAATVAAESLGLGTVPIGDVRLNAKAMIRELGLPKYVYPMIGLCVGYPASDPGLKPRLPKEAVYFEEKYNANLKDSLKSYDQTYAQYLKERPWNNRVSNWSDMAADFYREPFRYAETASALQEQGFTALCQKEEK